MSSAFGYDMGTSETLGNNMFGTLKKNQSIQKAQFEYGLPGEKLEAQTREGTEGFGISGGALKASKGIKDVIAKGQEIKAGVEGAVTQGRAAVQNVVNTGRNVAQTLNNATQGINRVAGTAIPQIPGAATPAGGGGTYGPRRAPLQTNLATSGDAGQDRTAIRGATQAQKGAVGDLDTAAQSTVKSAIQNHSIAGRNISGSSASDAFDTTNARASIINDGNDARYGLGGSANNLRVGQWGQVSQQLGLNTRGANAAGATNAHATPLGQSNSGTSALADAASDAEQGAKSALSAGLETAGGVLDALGPVGDLLGVGMAIFGGVEGAAKQASEMAAQKTEQAVIDAPIQSTSVIGVGKSLDTSHPGMGGPSASHF